MTKSLNRQRTMELLFWIIHRGPQHANARRELESDSKWPLSNAAYAARKRFSRTEG